MKKLKRVILIHPRNFKFSQKYIKLPCLEFCQMASCLVDAKIPFELYDLNIDDISNTDFRFKFKNSDLVVLHSNDLNHINTLELSSIIREKHEKITIFIQGHLPTFTAERILHKYAFIDGVIMGIQDSILLDVIDGNIIESGRIVNGLSYKHGDEYYINESFVNKINKNTIPFRHLYDMRKYLKACSETIIRTSWGCPGTCSFCVKTKYSSFKCYSMKRVFQEIDLLLKCGFETFFIADETFAFSKARLDEFSNIYKQGNYTFKWTSNLRVKDITDELISNMKECGAYRVFIGIESFNKLNKKEMKKAHDDIDIYKKCEILKKNKMEFHASFIIGLPGDSENDLKEIETFNKIAAPTLVTFNKIKIYPGTELFNNYQKYGIICEDKYWFENKDWMFKTLIYTNKLNAENIDVYSKKLMYSFFELD